MPLLTELGQIENVQATKRPPLTGLVRRAATTALSHERERWSSQEPSPARKRRRATLAAAVQSGLPPSIALTARGASLEIAPMKSTVRRHARRRFLFTFSAAVSGPMLTWTLALALLLTLNGCATHALWTEGSMSFHEPYPPSRLALFEVPEKGDVLAQYDELSPRSDVPRRRAYLLLENNSRIKSVKKPKFATLSATNGLAPIPLYAQSSDVPAGIGVYARTNETGNRFTIVRNAQPWHDAFDLPTYRCWTTTAKRATLTPLTLVLDVTIIGGFVYVWAHANSGGALPYP